MSALRRVARVEARLAPHRWLWAERERELIAAHWSRRRAARQDLFNGRVLMVAEMSVRDDVMTARFFETDYANLLAWIEHGAPGEPGSGAPGAGKSGLGTSVWNGFAMGALRGRDGAYVLGRMAAHTANAGRLYFPCGTPDLSDVTASGEVDLAASLTREIGEETGLSANDYGVEPGWVVVEDRGLVAFMRTVQLQDSAAAACRRIRAHLASEARPELADVEVAARGDALDEAVMPGVVPLFLRDAFAREPATSEPVAQG